MVFLLSVAGTQTPLLHLALPKNPNVPIPQTSYRKSKCNVHSFYIKIRVCAYHYPLQTHVKTHFKLELILRG